MNHKILNIDGNGGDKHPKDLLDKNHFSFSKKLGNSWELNEFGINSLLKYF